VRARASFAFRIQRALQVTKPTAAPHEANIRDQVGGPSRLQWSSPIASDESPRFGWLGTWINGYPEPSEVRCNIFLRFGNLRPRIVLRPIEYPLAVEQHRGITLDRVKEIAAGAGHL
jgi:hypothetical protein